MTNSRVPLRVDFAGGWLDVPRFAIPNSYIVNCAISPLVEIKDNNPDAMYWEGTRDLVPPGSGLGTSAAWHMLNGRDADVEESKAGCGWQDAAVIRQTGLCVWKSGTERELVMGESGDWLTGLMALYWTGKPHCSATIANAPRCYASIAKASTMAFMAASLQDLEMMGEALDMSYEQQRAEGMDQLPFFGLASKYCGAGHGGYALYLFENQELRDKAARDRGLIVVEPYCK